MRNFGLYLGMAFQITDDILDYFGDALEIGKYLGDDLAEGKMTLPLIRVMQVGNNEEISLIKEAITKKDRYAFQEIIKIIESKHVIEYCKEVAKKYRDLAIAEIEDLGSNHASEELRRLCQISVLFFCFFSFPFFPFSPFLFFPFSLFSFSPLPLFPVSLFPFFVCLNYLK